MNWLKPLVFFVLFQMGLSADALAQTQPIKHTLQANGHVLALWEKRAAKPTRSILLIHGRTWSALPNFDLQVPGEQRSLMDALVAKGYAVYALDLPGYGPSPRDKSGWITPNMAVDDIVYAVTWIDQESGVDKKPVLFGWSMGSTLAQLTVQQRPELVSSLILFGYWKDPDLKIKEHKWLGSLLKPGEKPLREKNSEQRAAEDFVAPHAMSKVALAAYVRAAIKADPIRIDIKNLEDYDALDPKKVTVPTLLLQGEFDARSSVDLNARLFARLGHPDRQWTIIAGGDHAAFLENTQPAFVSAMVEFIERPRWKP